MDYYGFFLPSTIRDRRAAISAIVAGVVANGLLTVLMGFACVVWILREGSKAKEDPVPRARNRRRRYQWRRFASFVELVSRFCPEFVRRQRQ